MDESIIALTFISFNYYNNLNLINIISIYSAVLIASALTTEANKQSRYNNKPKILSQDKNANNNNTGKPAQHRFNFFDYSMIPDKDPRAFVSNNKQKTLNDDVFVKDQK